MSDELLSPEPARTSPMRTSLLIGGCAFLGGMLATAGIYQFSPRLHSTPPAAPVVASGSQAPTTVPALPPGTDIATLNAREQELATRLDALDLRLRDTEGSARSASGYASRAEQLLIAAAARRALERGQPLGPLEGQLRQRFADTHAEAVTAILIAGRQPVTIEDLRLALDTIAPRLASNPNESLWTRTRRTIGELVVVRHMESPSPRTSDRLRRARRALVQGDVEAALAEVVHMPGAPQAESWADAAKRYIAARQGLSEIERAALEQPSALPMAAPAPARPATN